MELKYVEIEKIIPNKANPRGIDIPTQDQKLPMLKDSISSFGVMVPIVVTPRGNEFLLVDGERRYHAAKAAGSKTIPAYVIGGEGGKPLSPDEILFRMFQIHHLREQWGAVQQCHALEATYKEVVASPAIKKIKDAAGAAKAAAIALGDKTGIDTRTAYDRVKFLRWPNELKKRMYDNPQEEGYWYICEIEDKIIIPSLTNYPEYFEKVSVNEVRGMLFRKLGKSLVRSTDVRKVAPYFRAEFKTSAQKKKVKSILDKLIKKQEMTYEDAQNELEHQFPGFLQRDPPSPRKVVSLLVNLQTELERFDVESIVEATRRASARPVELLGAAESLAATIEQFILRIKKEI